eukprot:m51a1_g2440 hypothetical protein (275) ;mRNA; r:857010-858016
MMAASFICALLASMFALRATAATCSLQRGTWFDYYANGTSRRSLVYIPTSAATSNAPMIVALHYWGGTPEAMKSSFLSKANSDGYIIVAPEGYQSTWNAGIIGGEAMTSKSKDTAFISTVVTSLIATGCVDKARVATVGFSLGAFMVHRLAAETTGIFSAFVACSGLLGDKSTTGTVYYTCTSNKPVNLMHLHGTSDTTIYYDGHLFSATGSATRSASESFKYWATHDSCDSTATTVSYQKDTMSCASATCSGSREVVLCTVTGGTHSVRPMST